MRAKLKMRPRRVAEIAAGVMLVAVPSALAAAAPAGHVSHKVPRATAATAVRTAPSANIRFALHSHRSAAVVGHTVNLPGRLVIAKGGHKRASAAVAPHRPSRAKVKLEAHIHGRWDVVRHTRTGSAGRFDFHYRVARDARIPLRIRFAGSRYYRATRVHDGHITGLVPEVASWYYDGGNTACGFHATYGVANKTLPCGTHVRIEYGGRSVVATVDDRGPFVYGRTYDLNENTASALGMEGVDTVYASRA